MAKGVQKQNLEPKLLSSKCYSHVTSTSFDPNALPLQGDLAAYPMAVIATWSRIDCLLADFLSSFLHTPDLKVTLTMYQALHAGSKRVALEAAASEALSPDDLHLFRAVLKVIRPSQQRRHDYAHHVWGFTTDIPDALLLADSRAWVRRMIEPDLKRKALRDPSLWAKILIDEQPSETPSNWHHIHVYERDVLENDLADARAANAKVVYLRMALLGQGGASDQVRQMLLSEPSIQQALQHPSLENSPSVRPPPHPKKPSSKQRRTAALGKARASKAS